MGVAVADTLPSPRGPRRKSLTWEDVKNTIWHVFVRDDSAKAEPERQRRSQKGSQLPSISPMFFGRSISGSSTRSDARSDSTADPAEVLEASPYIRRSMWDYLPEDTPFDTPELESFMTSDCDQWLHEFSGVASAAMNDDFQLEVRLPDKTVFSVTCKATDSAASAKQALGALAGISSEDLERFSLYYQTGRVEEALPLAAYECPWNGVRMELKDAESVIAGIQEYVETPKRDLVSQIIYHHDTEAVVENAMGLKFRR